MPCAGAGVSSLGIAGRFITTGIRGERNSSGDKIRTDSRRCICSFQVQEGEGIGGHTFVEDVLLEFVVFELRGSLGFSVCFSDAFAPKFLGRAPNSISTSEYSAKAPLSIIIWLMLS